MNDRFRAYIDSLGARPDPDMTDRIRRETDDAVPEIQDAIRERIQRAAEVRSRPWVLFALAGLLAAASCVDGRTLRMELADCLRDHPEAYQRSLTRGPDGWGLPDPSFLPDYCGIDPDARRVELQEVMDYLEDRLDIPALMQTDPATDPGDRHRGSGGTMIDLLQDERGRTVTRHLILSATAVLLLASPVSGQVPDARSDDVALLVARAAAMGQSLNDRGRLLHAGQDPGPWEYTDRDLAYVLRALMGTDDDRAIEGLLWFGYIPHVQDALVRHGDGTVETLFHIMRVGPTDELFRASAYDTIRRISQEGLLSAEMRDVVVAEVSYRLELFQGPVGRPALEALAGELGVEVPR